MAWDRWASVTTAQSAGFIVVMAALVIAISIASRRPRRGEPFRRRPAAIILLVTVCIIAALCAFLATRHGP
jgi:drug/metabolite transporter (DMT)-like permease